jgi:hypothetical protein
MFCMLALSEIESPAFGAAGVTFRLAGSRARSHSWVPGCTKYLSDAVLLSRPDSRMELSELATTKISCWPSGYAVQVTLPGARPVLATSGPGRREAGLESWP